MEKCLKYLFILSNSLAAYSTTSTVLRGAARGNFGGLLGNFAASLAPGHLAEEGMIKRYILLSHDPINRKIDNIEIMHWQSFIRMLWSDQLTTSTFIAATE